MHLSGIFVRDYLLDPARETRAEYREQLEEFRENNLASVAELRALASGVPTTTSALSSCRQSSTTTGRRSNRSSTGRSVEKISQSASFLRREVLPRREAVLAIA